MSTYNFKKSLRNRIYSDIKSYNLQSEVLKKFKKNFTNCTNSELISIINKHLTKNSKVKNLKKKK